MGKRIGVNEATARRRLCKPGTDKRVLCGHVHRSIQTWFAGTIAQSAPSVSHQVAFDLRPDGGSCFVLEPPAFLLHRLGETGVVTHEVQVDRAPGPFLFVLPADYPGRR